MSVKARALEALIGAVPGAALGAAGGAATYAPAKSQFWLGEGGKVHGRNLTKEEQGERRKRALVGAALGAIAGGGSTLGGSRMHERLLRRYDAADAATVAEHYLAPLRKLTEQENSRVRYVPLLGRYSPESAENSKRLLERLSGVADEAITSAQAARAKRVFNGPLHVVDSAGNSIGPDPKHTARGIIHSRFADLGMDPRDPASYRKAIEKRAFVAEMQKQAAVMGLGVKISKKFGGTISKVPMVRPPSIVPGTAQVTSLGSSVTRTSALKSLTGKGPSGAMKAAGNAAPSVAK